MILHYILFLIFLNVIYHVGRVFLALKWGMHHNHYFLGFNPGFFTINFKGVKITFGLYIPIFLLDRIYKIENGQKEQVDLPWQFFQFKMWKRLTVTLAGVIALFFTGIFIFIFQSYTGSEKFISKDEVNRHGIYPSDLGRKAGFQNRDKILLLNGKNYNDFYQLVSPNEGFIYTVERNSQTFDLKIDKSIAEEYFNNPELFMYLHVPSTVKAVLPGSAAELAGIQSGDCIKKVNGIPVLKIFELGREMAKDEDDEVELEVERKKDSSQVLFTTTAIIDFDRKLGILSEEAINYSIKEYTFPEAVVEGLAESYQVIASNVNAFVKIFNGNIHTSKASGPIHISEGFDSSNLRKFWTLTGMFALLTAFYNLLPLPGCVFWQVVPIAYEKAFTRKFPVTLYKKAQWASYIILAMIMILVLGSDLIKLLA